MKRYFRPLWLRCVLKIFCSTLILFHFAEQRVMAQQTPLLSHYYYNPYLINPTYAGSKDVTRAFLFYRHQWIGIPGSPQTQAFTIDGRIDERPLGLGLTVVNDESDVLGRISGMLSASYSINLAPDHALSFGMSGGVIRNQLNFDKIRADASDPGLLANAENRTVVDANAGIRYDFRKLKIGFASEQLFNRTITYQNRADFREISFLMVRHYLLSAEYTFNLSADWDVSPFLLLRSAQGLKSQVDLNAMLKFRDFIWTNIAYRHNTGVGFSLGTEVSERFVFGYNYELPTSDLRYTTSGSHEFMLGIKLSGHKGSRHVSPKVIQNKAVEDLKRDTYAQYEKLDEIQQKNEALNEQLLEYKKIIEEQNREIEQLKKSVSSVDEEMKATIERLKVDLQTEGSFDKGSNYYLVIGALRTFEDAKAFQRIIRRETKLKPEIVQNDTGTWYFVYTEQLESAAEARKKIKELSGEETKPYIIGNPWVYKTKKN